MIRRAETIVLTVLLMAVYGGLARGQAIPPTILTVDIENVVQYQEDISDQSQFGTKPNITPAAPSRLSQVNVVLGDIVAVNGEPAKGTFVGRPVGIGLTPTPTGVMPQVSIADTTRGSVGLRTFEFMKSDGTQVGTIMVMGLNGGTSPPGQPAFGGQDFAIVGGTGAFLGVRGQQGGRQTPQTISPRSASIAEDPAYRRVNGGGVVRWLLYVIPMEAPQISATPNGPAVAHSMDFSIVTTGRPAAAGEVLSLFATGLGPTVPGVDPGQPFPTSPQAVVNSPIGVTVNGRPAEVLAAVLVNSPIGVTVNGRPAEVLAAVGFPGAIDGYQVNFL